MLYDRSKPHHTPRNLAAAAAICPRVAWAVCFDLSTVFPGAVIANSTHVAVTVTT